MITRFTMLIIIFRPLINFRADVDVVDKKYSPIQLLPFQSPTSTNSLQIKCSKMTHGEKHTSTRCTYFFFHFICLSN